MSAFDDNAWDNVYDVIKEFLREHNVSELLTILQSLVEAKEEGAI
jgi:hypothetical protein